MGILIGGDLIPTNSNIDLFNNGDVNGLLGDELHSIWSKADIRIFNLEVPLSDEPDPIPKHGPNLIAPTSTMKGIQALKPSLITLANNHILDHGITGLTSTENLLKKYNIPYLGVGDNLELASKPYILKYEDKTIGIYSCTENEFSVATDNSPGANPFDPLESLDHINELSTNCDYTIVLYHGGKENYRYPSPNLQKVCRKIVEKGADLVICQHSHCIGSYEKYNNSTIVYGQGNFIFNKYDNEFWNNGLLINLKIKNKLQLEFIPIIREKKGVRLATGEVAEEILSEFEKRSKKIIEKGFIEEKYIELAQRNIDSYLRGFLGFGRWLSVIDRRLLKGRIIRRRLNSKKLLKLQNFIECETHRELVLTGLKEKDD